MDEILNDRYEDNRSMSLSARDQYEREISWLEAEPLSPEEEKKYLDRILRARRDPSNKWLQSIAKDACERLTEHYQPLVRRVVTGYGHLSRGMDFLDLVQEANMALLQAFDTCPFDLRGSFAAWVIGCIRVGLKKFCLGYGVVSISNVRVCKGIADIVSVEQRYILEFGRSPSSAELSSELGLSQARIYELLHYRRLRSIGSVEAICDRYEIPEDCHEFTQMYRLFSEDEKARSDVATARVECALSQLPRLQREVTRLRYGLCGESSHTEQEVCDLLGIKDDNAGAAVYLGKKKLRVLLAPLYEGQEVAV